MYNAIHFCLYSLLLTLYSCRGDEVIYPTIGTHVTNEVREGGLYVLCEGNMGSNKCTIDYLDLSAADGLVHYQRNIFAARNPSTV